MSNFLKTQSLAKLFEKQYLAILESRDIDTSKFTKVSGNYNTVILPKKYHKEYQDLFVIYSNADKIK